MLLVISHEDNDRIRRGIKPLLIVKTRMIKIMESKYEEVK